ncbi:hypothetical protein MSAN_00819700 [Mycena sanguinolenta]|uniref:Uncharacterized protein n=1 Tax=Mycena sanguinolenta TaxID=230812 RepID=A0A8H6Z0D2_9AGAR|nr:hypothetical protein MSAN_00819700 [Mycena sanguinolenta]
MTRYLLSEEICPQCGIAPLTQPKKSVGYYNPANEERYYQHCSRNNFTDNALCRYFYFTDTVQRLYEEGAFGVDEEISRSHLAMSSMPQQTPALSSIASPHKTKNRQPCSNVPCRHSRNTTCIQSFCKACCLSTNQQCSAPQHTRPNKVTRNSFTVGALPTFSPTAISPMASPSSVPSTPTPASTGARAYARPIDPAYAAKLVNGDFTIHNPAHQLTIYKRAQTKSLEVHWWHQDGEAAEVFVVQAPGFPHFHPKDCLVITDFLGGEAKAQTFAYWSGQQWVRTDLPVTVKINTPLYLRSSNVTHCIGGPTSGTKRKLSITAANSNSPLRRIRYQSPDLDPLAPLVFPETPSLTKSATPAVIDLSSESDGETPNSPPTVDVFYTGYIIESFLQLTVQK